MQAKKMEQNKNLEDAVECRICNLKSHDLTSHISRIHGGVESYYATFPGAQIRSEKYLEGQSDRIKGSKNPAYQHGGRLSPFSKNFIHADEIDITKLYEQVASSRKQNNNDTTSLEYYTSRGETQEQGKKSLSKRQSTFSLKKCITKHGKVEGKKVWVARQEKWQSTLNSKPIEERILINQKKMNPDYCISKAEKEIGDFLVESGLVIKTQYIIDQKICWIYDIAFGKKIIEYHGDYWHCNPKFYQGEYFHKKLKMQAREKWAHDLRKSEFAISSGYQYLIIWEHDYKKDPQKALEECICFLKT